MKRFRRYYGAAPLHLVATIGGFMIIGAAFANWFHTSTHAGNIVVWFVGCLLAVDVLLIPLAWALDRITSWPASRRLTRQRRAAGCAAYVRIPAMLSGVLLIASLPLILRLGSSTFHGYTGLSPSMYLGRWLETSAALFAISAVLYAGKRVRERPTALDGPGKNKAGGRAR